MLIAVYCRMCNNSLVPVNQLSTYHKLQTSRIQWETGAGTKVPRHNSSSDESHGWTRADQTQQKTQHEAVEGTPNRWRTESSWLMHSNNQTWKSTNIYNKGPYDAIGHYLAQFTYHQSYITEFCYFWISTKFAFWMAIK